MKKLITLALGLAILALPTFVSAGVDGGSHDMVGADSAIAAQFTDLNLCTSCHLPHNATGATGVSGRLWAEAIGAGSGVSALCNSCHNGTLIAQVQSDPFTTGATYQKHAMTDEPANCSGQDVSCHDVHNQNNNTTGKFLATTGATTGACADCHDGSFTGQNSAHSLSDNGPNGKNHPQPIGCGMCHVLSLVHGTGSPVTQSSPLEANGAGTWLLPIDNHESGKWGGACVACHQNTSPYVDIYTGNGGSLADSAYFNDAPASQLGRHTTSGVGPHAEPAMTGCDDCHYAHEAGFTAAQSDSLMLQVVANQESDGCQSCHATADAPTVGNNTHPVDKVPAAGYTMGGYPLSNTINDDGLAPTNDYNSQVGHIVCESCHSTHRLGTPGTPFLRGPNANDEFCNDCHTAN